MRFLRFLLIAALPLSFVGCAEVATPTTLNQRIAYAYAGLAAARDTAAQLLERKQITVETAKKVQVQADVVRTALDTANVAAGGGDFTKAEDQLRLALTLLTALEAQLKAQGG